MCVETRCVDVIARLYRLVPSAHRSILQLPQQHNQRDVRRQTQRAQHGHTVAARAELFLCDHACVGRTSVSGMRNMLLQGGVRSTGRHAVFRLFSVDSLVVLAVGIVLLLFDLFFCAEKLPVALVAAVDGDEHDGGAVDSKERADGVELGREDLEDDKRKRKLRQGCAHVCALKSALSSTDLDESEGLD